MMGWVAGAVEAVAVAMLVSLAASWLTGPALAWVRGVRAASRRADLAFVLGLVPMAAAVMVWIGLMLPSLLHSFGLRVDHCDLHAHHAHLCALHFGGHHLSLVAVGSLALVVASWRGLRVTRAQSTSTTLLTQLEKLGTPLGGGPFPVVTVPGSPWLCVAVGIWRRRVILSASLTRRLAPDQLRAVLAHEQAHLTRNDPLMKVVLAWAGLCSLPSVAKAVQQVFDDAAEQASDAESARVHGPLVVAESLMAMVRIVGSGVPATSLAFGSSSLERRVAALLEDARDTPPSRAAVLTLGLVVASAVVTPLGADAVHHAVETLLQFIA